MSNKQHIEEIEELAALFSLGALPVEDAARFEQRISAGCALCIGELSELRKVVHALPLAAPEMAPPAGLKTRLMNSIGQAGPAKPIATEGRIVRASDTEWVDGPMPGVQIRSLLGKRTVLMRLAPKTFVPEHDHPASEQCLVLEGSVTSDGVTAYAGDFTYMPKGTHHTPLYSEDGCLLLIAYT